MAAASVAHRMKQLDSLTQRRRRNKLLLFPEADRRPKLLSQYRGAQAFRNLATPHPWTDALNFHLPLPKGKNDFHTQAAQLQTELNELYSHELDLDNADPYPGIGNDKKGVQERISKLETKLQLRANQENLLYSMSKKDLVKSVNTFRFQRSYTDLPSAEEMRKGSKTDLVVLLTEEMGESYQDIRDSVGLDDWL
jgi:hypothetical protein